MTTREPSTVDPATLHMLTMLTDPKRPAAKRAQLLFDMLISSDGDRDRVIGLLSELLGRLEKEHDAATAEKLKAKYEQALQELENGPTRPATFVGPADGATPGSQQRAHVITPDGQERFPTLQEGLNMADLQAGNTVYLDAKGAVLLGSSSRLQQVGQAATLVRRLEATDLVEVDYREERVVAFAARPLLDAEEAGDLARGDRLLFCPTRHFAFSKLPAESDRRHRFVDDNRIPDVVANRDIGAPHWILGWLNRRLHLLMHRPDLVQRYGVRQRAAVAMVGPSGTGKTLTIKAFLSELRREINAFTGRTDLGSRVIRAKTSDLLSEWFGRSDKNIDEFFDDVQWLASRKVETADGRMVRLPVVVIIEEAEGMGQRRGGYDGGVYDRIIGIMLQRLDDPTDELASLPIFFLTTSNRPDMLDSAMWRRLAGKLARFGRLTREGFAAVLDRKLDLDLPYATSNGTPPEELRGLLINQVVASKFSPNGEEQAKAEITLRDGAKLVQYGRDFLTGAVTELAVANAVDDLAFAAIDDESRNCSLSAAALLEALDDIIDGLADNLTRENAGDYVDLPDQADVASVRRLRGANDRISLLSLQTN